MARRTTRDRRGHGLRGPLAWPPVPSMISRRTSFDEAVLDAVAAFERRFDTTLLELEVATEDVPPTDPAPWEVRVVMGRLFPATGDAKARVVLYRRPIEAAARTSAQIPLLIGEVVTEQLAAMLGIDPDDRA
ncbi:MAG: metallopeptidase family protein [Ornithinimicrobium sp.]